ncbi:MAG: winged helix-turn-helix domain-containing protein [Candidatus Eremiobacteraeota bacterium]|nr:winged helix-turn-helix domain-containing protein [Candidatus Eremiobacteraeota bacterium]
MPASLFRFGSFQLESDRRALYFQGARIALTPKELDLLLHLVRASNRTVTKDELIFSIWPSEGITDANLAQVVYRLRKTLALSDSTSEYIATIPGQGYQFVAETFHAPESADPVETIRIPDRAFQLYRNARYLLALRTGASMVRSIGIFEEAIEIEPRFALAHVGLAEAYAFLVEYLYMSPRIGFPKAKQAALQALEIDPNCAEAHSALGEVLMFFERDCEAAGIAHRMALAIAPYSTTARLLSAWHALYVNEGAAALRELKAALLIDPGSVLLNTSLGVVKFYCRDFAGAATQLQDVLWLEPDATLAKFYLALVKSMLGEYTSAIEILNGIPVLEYEIQTAALLGYCFARQGDRDSALAKLAFLESPGEGREISNINRAVVLVGLRRNEAALDALFKAVECSEPWLLFVPIHPLFDEMRGWDSFASLEHAIYIR